MSNTYTFFWIERDGTRAQFCVGAMNFNDARAYAIENGYPGHSGGWWNWFVDDTHALLRKFFPNWGKK